MLCIQRQRLQEMKHMHPEAMTTMQMVKVPGLSAIIAMGINAFILGNTNMNANVYFGAAVFAGNIVADQVAKRVLPKSDLKELETRAIEIGGTSALAYALNRYVMHGDQGIMAYREPGKTIGTIAVSRAGAEMVAGMIPM